LRCINLANHEAFFGSNLVLEETIERRRTTTIDEKLAQFGFSINKERRECSAPPEVAAGKPAKRIPRNFDAAGCNVSGAASNISVRALEGGEEFTWRENRCLRKQQLRRLSLQAPYRALWLRSLPRRR
jgi:hypothetical protein